MDLETSKKVALPKGILSKRPRLSGISGVGETLQTMIVTQRDELVLAGDSNDLC